jgi:hypothetical protein
VIPVTFTKNGRWHVGFIVLEDMAMKKLLILGALAIFLAAHGVVTAMTLYPQLDAYICDGSNCWARKQVAMKEFFVLLVAMTIMAGAAWQFTRVWPLWTARIALAQVERRRSQF